MKNVLAKLREFYEGQIQLQELYLNRHETTGQQALGAMHTLHWSGAQLVGDWLPTPQLCGDRDNH
jgi:hypothetical protein